MRLRRGCWPPDYNNNGSRLILPQDLLTNRALAGDFLAIHQRIALSPNTSSQFIQAQRPRHSEIALSLGTSLQFTTESRVRLLLPRRTHARSLAALRGPARCPSWPRSLPLMAPRGFAPRGPAPLSPCSLPSGAPRALLLPLVVVVVVVVGPLSAPLGVGLPLVSVATGQADGPRPPRRLPGPGLQGISMYPPKGVRSKTKRAGIEGMGKTCWMTLEQIRASSLKMIVVVVVVVVEHYLF